MEPIILFLLLGIVFATLTRGTNPPPTQWIVMQAPPQIDQQSQAPGCLIWIFGLLFLLFLAGMI